MVDNASKNMTSKIEAVKETNIEVIVDGSVRAEKIHKSISSKLK